MVRTKKKPGGQPGNLNALKHGFYSRALKQAQSLELDEAATIAVDDLSGEIALLRQRILVLLEASPDKLELLCLATRAIANLTRTQYHLKGSDAAQLADAMGSVLQSIEEAMRTPPEPKGATHAP
jgi:hypothetical protein